MKILRFLIGCALALACAHEGKTVGRESNTAQATASQGVNPQAASTADASKQDTAAAAATRRAALPAEGRIPLSTTPEAAEASSIPRMV